MACQNSVEKYRHSSLDSKTEIAEQNMVIWMAEVPSNQPEIASASENVANNATIPVVADTEGKDPASELEYQNRNVKYMERESSNGLPKDYAPHLKSTNGGMEVNDEPRLRSRAYYSSAGYHVHTISNGIKTEHFYPWDSEAGRYRRCRCASHSSKSKGFSSMTQNGPSSSNNFPLNSRLRSYQAPSSLSKSSLHSQNLRQLHKECHPAMRSSPTRSSHQYGNAYNVPRNNYEFTPVKSYKGNNDSDVSKEIVCGPRAVGRGDFVKTNETEDELPYFARRKNFNLPDFQTEYENAKFYIIKSIGEDNVHKSVKYGVWSSTPYGNGKLETAYHEAKAKSMPIETGIKCPIFFFFSVNKSGQFVGLAEMIGRVDFSKDLDFWQLDKWSGFFPVKWHILKDIPHSELQHIILKENDNRSVTYTRDTQEISLCQGIEMLKIFKNYSAKTSLLDDFSFYENREKLRVAERRSRAEKQKSEKYELDNCWDEHAAGYVRTYYNRAHVDMQSVISCTRNLSLNSCSP